MEVIALSMVDPNLQEAREPITIGRIKIVTRGKKGTYVAEFHDRGCHRRVSLKTRNRKIAEERAKQIDAELTLGHFKQPAKAVEIDRAIDLYIEGLRLDGSSPKTLTKYGSELRNFAAFAAEHRATTVDRITPPMHDKYRAKRKDEDGLAEYTLHNHVVIHKSWLKWLTDRGHIATNPLARVKLKMPVRSIKRAATADEVARLLLASEGVLHDYIAVLAYTGLRSGELKMLRPQDVDLNGNWIVIRKRDDWKPKKGNLRKIPIHEKLRPHLQPRVEAKTPYVFCALPSEKYPNGGHYINEKHMNDRFKRLAVSLGMPVGRKDDGLVIHSLRHFFETFTINSGIPQRVVDVWMGHVGEKSTGRIYYQLTEEESQKFMKRVPF